MKQGDKMNQTQIKLAMSESARSKADNGEFWEEAFAKWLSEQYLDDVIDKLGVYDEIGEIQYQLCLDVAEGDYNDTLTQG